MRKVVTAEQKAAAEIRRAKFRGFAAKIRAMSDAERAALAARVQVVTIEGRVLSLHNQCLLAYQGGGQTIVGGFRQWLKAGRAVRKGEHGFMIWVFAGKEGTEGEPEETRFLMGTVFDVSQTDLVEVGGAAVPAEPLLVGGGA